VAIAHIGTVTPTAMTATSGSQSVTVTSGTDFAVFCWNGYSLSGLNISALTLNGVAFTDIPSVSFTGSGDNYGHGMEYWLTPSSGSQTLAWTWTNEPLAGEGPVVQVLFFSGVTQTAPIRDGDIEEKASTGGSSNTVTIDSTATDYVLGFCASWQNTIDCAGTGQTNLAPAFTGGSRFGRCGTETTPGSSSTTFDAPTAADAFLTAISIKEAAAGGGGGHPTSGRSRGSQHVRSSATYRMRNRIYVPENYAQGGSFLAA
jgi:hypothetical protein